jgi:hypothetical protein
VSRSYRKPYTAVTGTKSAHSDKKLAARGLRRRQNQWLHTLEDVDGALIPHRLECAHNNTYNWGRDGRQHLLFPDCQGIDRFDFMHRYWVKLHRK